MAADPQGANYDDSVVYTTIHWLTSGSSKYKASRLERELDQVGQWTESRANVIYVSLMRNKFTRQLNVKSKKKKTATFIYLVSMLNNIPVEGIASV